ncbi:competence type IV pilus assembly protein ComGB [Sporosarcina ureilytica]|uniref:Type II secretion system protein GspF domain-containing protein n=1 Tax=Sporosarcina ureilytica TaxID=298596 RepID=A0A1D8JGM2_9BACL|nr:competence type IV pilus assembly protein ComGB [Sporosarcina ureilytica]AOV07846.1 hypothetical protein BI350_10080 [Sporosarcina ureilytica]
MKNSRVVKQKAIQISERPVFLARIAELLNEGYTFSDAINLILPHHTLDYENVIRQIEEAFRRGLGVSAILGKFGFSDTLILSVIIAEKNGHLADVLQVLSKQLEKVEEAKRKLKNLLAYPLTLFVFIAALLMGFRNFFLPNMEALSRSRQGDMSAMSTLLPKLVSLLPDMIFGTAIFIAVTIMSLLFYYRKLSPINKIKFIQKIPVVRHWIFQWKSQQFARELGSLLESGMSIQDALEVLIQQNVDPVLGEIARNVKEYLIFGEPFHAAIALVDGLTKEFSSFAKHGEASGHLAKELLIYSAHLEESLHRKMTKGLALLQPALFSLIAICILAAYVALLLPIYNMLDTI